MTLLELRIISLFSRPRADHGHRIHEPEVISMEETVEEVPSIVAYLWKLSYCFLNFSIYILYAFYVYLVE